MAKTLLTVEELESQTALELPDRELMQTQFGLVNVMTGDIIVAPSLAVAAAICGVNVNVLAVQLHGGGAVNCPAKAGSFTIVRTNG